MQLTQAQKMESVGRLTGEVAHDFNNMLAVILGHTELALESVDPEQPLFTDLQEIRKAAECSANLTRQLLAFAHKQTVVPKVSGTFHRDVQLAVRPAESLSAVRASQFCGGLN